MAKTIPTYGATEAGDLSYGERLRTRLGLDERYLPAEPFETLTGVDIDVALGYQTAKYVRLRDARLGCLRLLLLLGIGSYVILYQLLYQGGYLKDSYPTGTVEFYLRQKGSTCRGEGSGDDAACAPCDVSAVDDDCYDVFGDVKDFAYCTQAANASYGGRKIACREEEYSQVEQVEDSSLFCTTRAVRQDQTKVCSTNPDDPLYRGGSCDEVYVTNATDEWYVADVDSFVVFIKHTFEVSELGISGNSDKTKGRLRSSSDALCDREKGPKSKLRRGERKHTAPCYIQPNITYSSLRGLSADLYDEIDLGVLLEADSDFSLDRYNGGANGTYRENGVTITVQIEYSNREDWSFPTSPAYTYKVKHQKGSSASFEDSYYASYPDGLTIVQNSGVKINFVQSGVFYSFDGTEALIRISTALALFAVATTVVDSLARYVMKHRDIYNEIMVEESQDFGDLCRKEHEESKLAAA